MPSAQISAEPEPALDAFAVSVPIIVRPCREQDLAGLEWFGAFRNHRGIITTAFARQTRGENLMLVAVSNGFPVGQVWLELQRRQSQGAGVLWALRVFPPLQRLGIGGRLLDCAERCLRERGFFWAELSVEVDNAEARLIYQRRGYVPLEERMQHYSYTTPAGEKVQVRELHVRMRKRLGPVFVA